MGSAFDAEMRALHDAADEAFGYAARYRAPSAEPLPLFVEKLSPRPEFSGVGGRLKITASAVTLMVQARYFGAVPPVKDAVFDLLDDAGNVFEKWRVIAAPGVSDEDGARYTIKVEAQP